MYFAHIETSRERAIKYNNELKAAAARRLGDYQRSRGQISSAKMASMAWNIEQHVANGAIRRAK